MSTKNSSARRAESIASATAQTRSAIEGLKGRLSGGSRDTTPRYGTSVRPISRDENEPHETEEELEKQLQAYFARIGPVARNRPNVVASPRAQLMDELRSRVIDTVADRILVLWSRPEPGISTTATLGAELTERLVQRILEQLRKPTEGSNIQLAM